MQIELTDIEAQRYAKGLTRLCDAMWCGGTRHDKHLLQKHLHSYNAVRELIGKLNDAVRQIQTAPPPGVQFDLDMARQNEDEAKALDLT